MYSLTCPYCGSLAAFQEVWKDSWKPSGGNSYIAAFRCPNLACDKVICAIREASSQPKVTGYWPQKVGGKSFPDVPVAIAAAANEAHECFSFGAYRGAIALARAAVEATAKAKGIISGTLEKKIDDLVAQGMLRRDAAEAAHAVRLVGNDAAHGDLASMIVDRDDAQDVLDLMDDVLDEVFQSPAKVARVKANRAARKASQ